MRALSGALDKARVPELSRTLDQWRREALANQETLTIDLGDVEWVDSTGAAALSCFMKRAVASSCPYAFINIPTAIETTLAALPFSDIPPPPKPEVSFVESIGTRTADAGHWVLDYLALTADVAWFSIAGLIGRAPLRVSATIYEMAVMGSRALGVVSLIAFLVGGTMALQAAAQLRLFGANIYIVDLVGVSLTRELGPLITAIVIAGRSGSSIAAELGTMVVTDEIDALKTMGLQPTRYLIVPKVIALVLVEPLLTMLANSAAILGAVLVGVSYLDISPTAFWERLLEALYLKDIMTGLFKSVLFAYIIATIGALFGMRTRGGAEAVGASTTASVVASIFAVIFADAACSLFFYFEG